MVLHHKAMDHHRFLPSRYPRKDKCLQVPLSRCIISSHLLHLAILNREPHSLVMDSLQHLILVMDSPQHLNLVMDSQQQLNLVMGSSHCLNQGMGNRHPLNPAMDNKHHPSLDIPNRAQLRQAMDNRVQPHRNMFSLVQLSQAMGSRIQRSQAIHNRPHHRLLDILRSRPLLNLVTCNMDQISRPTVDQHSRVMVSRPTVIPIAIANHMISPLVMDIHKHNITQPKMKVLQIRVQVVVRWELLKRHPRVEDSIWKGFVFYKFAW